MSLRPWSKAKQKDALVLLSRPKNHGNDYYSRLLRYMSSTSQMLQEMSEANGIASLMTVARATMSLVEALKDSTHYVSRAKTHMFMDKQHTAQNIQLNKTDSEVLINMIERIYGVICSIIVVCHDSHDSADGGLSRRTLRGISYFIMTLNTALSYIRALEASIGNSSKLLRRLSINLETSHPLSDECTKRLQKSVDVFQVQDDSMSDRLDSMHENTSRHYQELMDILKSRYLKRNGSSMWSLSDTLRIFKRHEESLNEIVNGLQDGFHPARIAILGTRGAGKTSLALAALHHSVVVNHYGARRYFIDCSAVQSEVYLVERIAKFFGFKRVGTPMEAIETFFMQLSEPALLVLDDFPLLDGGASTEVLLSLLDGMNRVDILVTMSGTVKPSGLQWTRSISPHLQSEVLQSDQPCSDDNSISHSDDDVRDPNEISSGASGTPKTSSLPLSSPGLTPTKLKSFSADDFPSFPSPVSSFSALKCSVSQVNKYYPGSSSWKTPLFKSWRSRFLMLSCPAEQSDSRLHPVAYLHIFKSLNPTELELERLEIDAKSFVTPGHERESGIQRHVIRVGGLGIYPEKKGKLLKLHVNEVTTWCFQVQDDIDSRKWMLEINSAVHPFSGLNSYQDTLTSAPENLHSREIQEVSATRASPSNSLKVSAEPTDMEILQLEYDWSYLSLETSVDVAPPKNGRDSNLTESGFNVYERLSDIFRDRIQYKRILSYRGERAQLLLDFLQSLLDDPKLKGRLRTELVRALVRLSKQSALYPTCFALKNVEMDGEDPLNGGHFGDIWKGRYQMQNVCLKVVKVYQKSDIKKLLAAFSVEALLWAQLSHPNLLPFYGVYHLEDKYNKICLVSPWMDNGNIHEFLQQNPQANRFLLVNDVVEGIIYLHANHMIHGDLKGANILVAPSGRACLADFGLSAVAESDALRWTSLTSTAPRGGTVRWQAPELISSSDESKVSRSPASDIYAFSCVCYEIFTGQCPFFDVALDVTVMLKIMKGERPPRPPLTHPAWSQWGLSDAIWKLMVDCWKPDVSERPVAIEIRNRIQPTVGNILDDRPSGNWDNFSTSRFRGTVHDYPTIGELERILD